MLYSDLREIKAILEIDKANTSEDLKLNFIIEQISSWIEQLLGRPNLTYKLRTEYYSSTSTGVIVLRSRPTYSVPTPLVYIDQNGNFGSTSGAFASNTLQVYGQNFCLKIDQDDGIRSRCGLLIPTQQSNGLNQNGAWWNNQQYRQWGFLSPYIAPNPGSIKVVYYAGYTVDDLPAVFRMACNLLIARLRVVLPLGLELSAESYEERSIAIVNSEKDKLLAIVKPMLWDHRNWSW